jgi:cysteine desulfurase
MIYLDNNATTRVADEVVETMRPFYTEHYGNPHSAHALGRRSHDAVERARSEVAALVHSEASSVYFTSCGTEANALVILGLLQSRDRRKIVATAVEHSSVLSLLHDLAERGLIELALIPADRHGLLDLAAARRLIDDRTLLVSTMLAQNETGVIHPVEEIAGFARAVGALTLVDAVQATGKIDVDPASIGADFATFSGHKLHAPKGIGALFIRQGLSLPPLWRGGGQERGLRSGTESVPLIVGFGRAAVLARERLPHALQIGALRDRLQQRIGGVVNGAEPRLPNTLNVSFPGIPSTDLVLELDQRGVCASGGAACQSGNVEPTPVMRAMNLPYPEAIGAVRFSLSRYTTADEIETAADAVLDALSELQPQEKV